MISPVDAKSCLSILVKKKGWAPNGVISWNPPIFWIEKYVGVIPHNWDVFCVILISTYLMAWMVIEMVLYECKLIIMVIIGWWEICKHQRWIIHFSLDYEELHTFFYKQLGSEVRAQVAYWNCRIWGLKLLMSCLQKRRFCKLS